MLSFLHGIGASSLFAGSPIWEGKKGSSFWTRHSRSSTTTSTLWWGSSSMFTWLLEVKSSNGLWRGNDAEVEAETGAEWETEESRECSVSSKSKQCSVACWCSRNHEATNSLYILRWRTNLVRFRVPMKRILPLRGKKKWLLVMYQLDTFNIWMVVKLL